MTFLCIGSTIRNDAVKRKDQGYVQKNPGLVAAYPPLLHVPLYVQVAQYAPLEALAPYVWDENQVWSLCKGLEKGPGPTRILDPRFFPGLFECPR